MALPGVYSAIVGILRGLYGLVPGQPTGGGGSVASPFTVGSGSQTVTITTGANQTILQGTGALTVGNNVVGTLSLNGLWTVENVGGHLRSGTLLRALQWASDATSMSGEVTGVIRMTDASGTNPTWLQQTAGCNRLAADSAANTTITPLTTGMGLVLKAGRVYTMRLVLRLTQSVAVDGVRIDFDGGNATMTTFAADARAFTPTEGCSVFAPTSAIGTDITFATFTTAGVVVVDIYCVVNGAGTFIPRFALNAATTGSLVVKAGSSLIASDMP